MSSIYSFKHLLETRLRSKEMIDVHILTITGPQSRIIQASNVRSIQVIEKDWIDNLFDRNTPDFFGGEE